VTKVSCVLEIGTYRNHPANSDDHANERGIASGNRSTKKHSVVSGESPAIVPTLAMRAAKH
jgi:hypothetical protein